MDVSSRSPWSAGAKVLDHACAQDIEQIVMSPSHRDEAQQDASLLSFERESRRFS